MFILHQLSQMKTSDAMGLYRDDGLAIFRNTSGQGVERIRKDISKTFHQHGLQVTAEANIIDIDFLDIWYRAEPLLWQILAVSKT